MSGCCGQGPVIVSGAAATPRVDVETQLMCDVLPDGTVAATVLVEPVFDTSSGARVATRITDPATGDLYTPVGEIQVCPTSPDCESPTTPVTSVGLCLADGTPIAVTVIRDCAGAVTSEGWLNLTTGAWSAGAVPAGTVACGDSRSIQVSGTFCDVDDATGDVLGLVLVEYTYDDTGAIAAVRLVYAVTGGTYTPTGTVTVCPASVEQPERDLVQLCDTAAGGAVTAFVRDYARDENGAIVGHSDYDLDGAPYTPAGTVGLCGATPCRDSSSTLLCDVTTTESVTVFDPANVTGPDGWQVVSFTGSQPGFGPIGAMPYDVVQAANQLGQVSYGARPDLNSGPTGAWPGYDNAPVRWIIRKTFTAPEDGTATLTAVGFQADGGGRVRVNGVDMGLYSQWGQPGVGGGGQAPVTAGPNVIEIEVRDDWGPNWVTGRLDLVMTRTVEFFRKQVTDCETGAIVSQTDTTLDGQPYTVTGEVGQCTPVPDSSCCETPPQVDTEVLHLCDVATDGTVTAFLRQFAYLNGSAIPVVTDTALDGITPYTAAGEVGSCGAAEGCRDSSTVLVCDVPADSTTVITPTLVDGTVADVGQTQFQNHPGPYTDLWAGNTFLYPAGAGPDQEHLAATGQLTADMAGCDGASGTVTISVRVRNDGPDTGQAWDGALRLFRGTTAIAAHNALEWAPPGWQGTLTVSAPVTAADIAAGDIRVALILETYHLGAKSWTADQFTAAIELEGCEVTSSTQFLRTLVTDCESGEVVSTVDTTLDGQPYTVTGEVAQCTPADTGSDPALPEQDVVELCDVQADGTVLPLIRDYRRDATGAVIGYSDYGLEGTPYTATGTVGRCCTDVVDTRCVRLVTDDVEIFTGADWVVYSDPTTPTAMPVETSAGNAISALPVGTDTVGAEHYVGFLYSPSNIGGGTAYLHVSQLAAPGAEILGLYFAGEYVGRETGWWRLPYEGQQHIVIHYRTTSVIANAPVVAATLSLADSLNNGSGADSEYTRTTYCDGRVEYRDSGSNLVPNPVTSLVAPCFDRYEPVNAQCATTAVQTVRLCDLDPTVEADEDGRRCAVPFLRHLAYDCAGELAGFHDTGLDGTTPYTPVQVVDCQCASGQGITSSIEVPWQTVSVGEDPAGVAGQDFIYTVAPETDPTRIGTIRVHVSRPAGGACGAYDINNLVFSNTAAYTLTLDAVAQEMSYLRVDLMDFDTFEPVAINTAYPLPDRLGGTAGWNATNNRIVPSESNGTGYMYWDNPPETVGWSVLNQGGGTSCSALSFQGMTVEPGGCCGGDSDGCGQCAPVNTAIRRLASAGTFDAATLGTLQSVTVTVLAGSVAVATNNGTGEVPAGASLSWSVVNDSDTGLGALTITTDAGDDVLVTATYK